MSSTTKPFEEKMNASVNHLVYELASIRAGRANPQILDKITVDYYGTPTALNQVGNISSPEPRMLVIAPWEAKMIGPIEKAIQKSDLGINPSNDGKVIRLVVPELNEERRKELCKQVRKQIEEGKVAVRAIRRDAMEAIKKMKKDSVITEDEQKTAENELQKVTDSHIKELDAIGAKFLRDVEPGEIVTISDKGLVSDRSHCGHATAECVFEFIYFARPDSVIDGSCVHTARQRAGAFLALEHPVQADVVIGVPDSGLDAALGYAKQSGIPYGVGFVKSKYIGRTFIQPGQARREDAVRIKLNTIASTVRGKRVILVDDSIVRGTTIARIVGLLREAGATEVHARLSAPPFRYPCYFGTDIDSSDNLIAYNHSLEEIREMIGVDTLGYLNVDYLDKLADNSHIGFCKGCFTGEYPCDPPCRAQKSKFEQKISRREDDE